MKQEHERKQRRRNEEKYARGNICVSVLRLHDGIFSPLIQTCQRRARPPDLSGLRSESEKTANETCIPMLYPWPDIARRASSAMAPAPEEAQARAETI